MSDVAAGADATQTQADGERSLEGRAFELGAAETIRQVVEDAFDYRGDITLERGEGEPIEGFIFDRHFEGDDVDGWSVRMLLNGSTEKIIVPVREITKLTFSGKDTAHGKSFERWMEKYRAKKQAEAEARSAGA
ncbi:MAG: hypothetical protein AAF235_01415 [Planctomycetota bacterium]